MTLACFDVVEALKSHRESNVQAAVARAEEVGCGPRVLEVAKATWAEINAEVDLQMDREIRKLEMEARARLAAEMERVNRAEAPTAAEPVVPTAPAYAPEITSSAEAASAHLLTGAGESFCNRVEREIEDGARSLPKVADYETAILAMTARGCDVTIYYSIRNYAKVEIPTRALTTIKRRSIASLCSNPKTSGVLDHLGTYTLNYRDKFDVHVAEFIIRQADCW